MNKKYQNLDEALLDVRRAYRIVAAYQRRIIDIVGLLAAEFEGMRYYFWDPYYMCKQPSKRSFSLPNVELWNGLPLYSFSYFFLNDQGDPNHLKPGDWMLEIRVRADDCFDHEANDLSKMEPSDNCKSLVIMYAWCCNSERSGFNWYSSVWSNYESWPESNGESDPLIDDDSECFGSVVGLEREISQIKVQLDIISFANDLKSILK